MPLQSNAATDMTADGGTTINGNAQAALLIGTPGDDTISASNPHAFIDGNGGQDTIALGTTGETVGLGAPGKGLDTIQNFHSRVDHLAFDFNAYGVTPDSYAFQANPGVTPGLAAPTFYFDTSTDYLWFDPDGTGSQGADLLAFLPGVQTPPALYDLTPAQISFDADASVVNQTENTTTYGEGQNQTLWTTGVAGVIFVAGNGDGPGVHLRKAAPGAGEITLEIQALEQDLASIPTDTGRSPEAALHTMDRATVENQLVELRHKRKRIRKAKSK